MTKDGNFKHLGFSVFTTRESRVHKLGIIDNQRLGEDNLNTCILIMGVEDELGTCSELANALVTRPEPT